MNAFRVPNTFFPVFILFFIGLSFHSTAQERGLIQSKYYSSADYNAGTQNWAIAQDARGVLYFGNISGILEFDGETWRIINVANESTVRSLALDKQGKLYVGAFGEMGYLAPDRSGNMQYHSLLPLIEKKYSDFGEIWDINCFSDTVFFLSDHYLFRFHDGKFRCWESKGKRFYLSHKVNESYYIQELGKGLMKFYNDSIQLIGKGDYFSDIRIHTIFPTENGLLICTRTDGFYTYDNADGHISIKPFSKLSANAKRLNNYFIEHSFYHGIELSDNLYALSSITGDILVVNRNWEVVDIINEESIGIKSPTNFLYFQKNHSLWLGLANGISQVEIMSPLRYWNEDKGVSGVITDVARVSDMFYISTGSGVFYTKNPGCEDFTINRFSPVEGIFEQSWSFLYFQPSHTVPSNHKTESSCITNQTINEKTILLAATSRGLFQIIGTKTFKIAEYNAIFKAYQSKKKPDKLILGLNNGIALLTFDKGNWINEGMKYGLEANIRELAEDSIGNIWLCASYKGIYRITNPFSHIPDSIKIDLFDTSHGLPSVKSINLLEEGNKLFFYSEGDYYEFVRSENRFILEPSDKNHVSVDSSSNLFLDTLSWYRFLDDVISNYYVTTAEDTVLWFGTNSGIFKKNGGSTRNYYDLNPALIRKVISGDSILFNGTNYRCNGDDSVSSSDIKCIDIGSVVDMSTVLNFKSNSLTFYYTWPFFEGEKENRYSFFLVGYDHGWSEWSSEIKKEYTNLPEGDYVFRVKAKNLYNLESSPAEFHFSILPPWYRTYFAFAGYFIISLLIIILIVKLYTYRLILEKEKLEGIVKERTQEILMQNEEILVQAEHLKDANEWISAKNVELETQKTEIEKKKDQLEVSNATKNKFFRIIAHDLRNPISTLVSSTGYILTDIDEFDKQKTKHFIEDLNKLSLITYNLLENLLDWSTSQMGEISYNPKPVDLTGVVNENIELVRSKLNSKKIDLNISLPPTLNVLADENMVHTVIRNLITNAVKFTQDNGTIRIFAEQENDSCSISIADSGVGISKENLEKLFRIEKHVTTPGTHNEKGSGLGLILCKEFIERNNGKITVESKLGVGSTFTITLKMV